MLTERALRRIAILVVAGAAAFGAFLLLAFPRSLLLQALIELEPKALAVHALFLATILVAFLVHNRRRLRAHSDFLLGAVVIAVIGSVVAAVVPPRTHRLYFDEDIYGQIALSIARESKAGMLDAAEPSPGGWTGRSYSPNKEPTGFPFLVSLVVRAMQLAGARDFDAAGSIASRIFFFLAIVGVAVLARGLLPERTRDAGALVAAALFALWPENLRWAVTGAAETTAAALAIWTLVLAREASRADETLALIAGSLMLALAVEIRPEGLLLVVPFLAMTGTAPWRNSPSRGAVALAAFTVFVALNVVHLAAMSGEDWGASGPKFALAHIASNLKADLGYWLHGGDVRATPTPSPTWMLLALVGFATGLARAASRRVAAAAALWFAFFFAVFIPFYAGSYFYGTDVRFSLLVVAPILLFAAVAVDLAAGFASRFAGRAGSIAYVMVAAIPFLAFQIPPLMDLGRPTAEAQQARADHAAVALFARDLPRDALVVSMTPSMWALRGFAAAQVSCVEDHPAWLERMAAEHPVYYHAGYWDVASDTGDGVHPERRISGARFEEVRRAESEGRWVIRLFRVTLCSGFSSRRS